MLNMHTRSKQHAVSSVVCVRGCRGLISGVIVMLNFVLKAILQWLIEWEKHWTQSDAVSSLLTVSQPAWQVANPRQCSCRLWQPVAFLC